MATATKPKPPRAAPSAKQKANQTRFANMVKGAVDFIYQSGKKGAIKPSWKTSIARSKANQSGVLSGVVKPKAKRKKA